MARLSVHGLSKYFGERALFTDLAFEIGERDRIGLVGDNGCGKTTLLRILMGEESADGGDVVRAADTRIGYMEQHTCREASRTLWDEVESVFADVMAMERELADINASLAAGQPTDALLDRQLSLRERFEAAGGLYYKSRVRVTLLGLGFPESAFDTPVGVLSGGQRSKAAMGRLLLANTNLLLLDEPTNHLDIPSVEWLEEYLINYTGAVVVISHDRYLLDRVTDRTIELKDGRLYMTAGSYSAHKEKRARDREIEQKHYKTAMQEIHRIEENITLLKQWNREKSIRAAESREKRVERLREDLVAPETDNRTVSFRFEAAMTSGNEVLTVRGLAKSFGDNHLFTDADMTLMRGERAFLLGANGCGKTTFLRLLRGEMPADAGFVRAGAKVSIGYYDQVQQGLDGHKTAIGELWDAYPHKTETEIRSALAAFLFRGDDVYKPIGVMSGGERARLLLLKLMLAGDNLLLLDEPTNHLDIASREALEEALEGYDGTILAVSHDRYFINRMATRVLELRTDGIRDGGNNYDAVAAARAAAQQPIAVDAPKPRENDYQERKERESTIRRLRTAIRRTEEQVAALEEELAALNARLTDEAVVADYALLAEITADIDARSDRLDEAMSAWEDAQQRLEDMEKS